MYAARSTDAIGGAVSTSARAGAAREAAARAAASRRTARRAGCMIFALWEDITECKPKMLLVLFATLMQRDMRAAAAEATQQRRMSAVREE